MATDQEEELVLAAARAYCAAQFTYDPRAYVSPTGAADHLAMDARSMLDTPWLVAVVAAVAPLIRRQAFNDAEIAVANSKHPYYYRHIPTLQAAIEAVRALRETPTDLPETHSPHPEH